MAVGTGPSRELDALPLPELQTGLFSFVFPRGGDLVFVAAGLAIGIALGRVVDPLPIWLLVIGGAIFGAIIGLYGGRGRRFVLITLCMVAAMLIGIARYAIQHQWRASDDLSRFVAAQDSAPSGTLMQLRARVLTEPRLRGRSRGSLADFGYQTEAFTFLCRAEAVLSPAGVWVECSGKFRVRCTGRVDPIAIGSLIELTGIFHVPSEPMNPGEFDMARHARSRGEAGVLLVASDDLITVLDSAGSGFVLAFVRDIAQLRKMANDRLLGDLPEDTPPGRRALLGAMLLGSHEPELDEVYRVFQRTGLAHVVAISGMNLSLLAMFVLLVVPGRSRGRGVVVLVTALAYLLLLDVSSAILRAGIMAAVAAMGLIVARRYSPLGLVALSGIALLLWKPDELFHPGFQLSFAVVLALLAFTEPLRVRWFGPVNQLAHTWPGMIGQWGGTAIAGAVAAWLAATPIVAWHYGTIAPLAAPLTLLIMPIASILLAVGYIKLLLALVPLSITSPLGAALSVLASSMVWVVEWADDLPYSICHVPFPSTGWVLAALAVITCWALVRSRSVQRFCWLLATLLTVALYWPEFASQQQPALRIDMLSVGDGSCYIFRSGGVTVLYDAGSISDLDVGRRMIVPAMRRLGIDNVDAVIISHANLDHYSAVIEIIEHYGPVRLLATEQFLEAAASSPTGPVGRLLSMLRADGSTIGAVAAGKQFTFGDSVWTVIHPATDERFDRDNDASLVVRIEAAGRSVLLTGDVQRAGLARLMRPGLDVAADVAELPHHGSFSDVALAFITERVKPAFVLQSTGRHRFRGDRWEEHLSGIDRYVTTRDGACAIVIWEDGRIKGERFVEQRETMAR